MRATVIVSEYLVYIPAVVICLRRYARIEHVGSTAATAALIAILMQPAVIIIDHGHFQYNTVMLGFVIASISSIFADRLLWACIFFVAALGFKQMALYYAPVMAAYLLGSCLTPRLRLGQLLAIAIVTAVSFGILFAPLLVGTATDFRGGALHADTIEPSLLENLPFRLNSKSPAHPFIMQIAQVVHRCFPFARGVFEDKVANFWCALNTVFKLRIIASTVALPKLALYATFISVLPASLIICAVPRPSLLPLALASSAWGFFLFSFQVHEKSVLLPLMPMTLLLGGQNGLSKEIRAWVGWANLIAMWTMYPLVKKDELKTPYVVLTLLWLYLMGLPPTSASAYYDHAHQNKPGVALQPDELRTPTKILHWWYLVIIVFWHLLDAFQPPPDDKPDLWLVLNACIGAMAFGICYLWCTWKLAVESNILDDYFAHKKLADDARSANAKQKKNQ